MQWPCPRKLPRVAFSSRDQCKGAERRGEGSENRDFAGPSSTAVVGNMHRTARRDGSHCQFTLVGRVDSASSAVATLKLTGSHRAATHGSCFPASQVWRPCGSGTEHRLLSPSSSRFNALEYRFRLCFVTGFGTAKVLADALNRDFHHVDDDGTEHQHSAELPPFRMRIAAK